MADTEKLQTTDLKADKKRLKDEKNKLKQEQKKQRKEARARAKEIALEEAQLDDDSEGNPASVVLITIVIVAIFTFAGTVLGSTIIAQIILKMTGVI